VNKEEEKLRKTLSQNIKNRRKTLGISQEKLAEMADLSIQTINGIEGCRIWISDKTMIKLSQALKLESYQLLMPELGCPISPGDPLSIENLLNFQQSLQKTLQQALTDCMDSQFLAFLRPKN